MCPLPNRRIGGFRLFSPPSLTHLQTIDPGNGKTGMGTNRKKSLTAIGTFLLVVGSVWGVDLVTKLTVEKWVPLGHSIPLLPIFSLTHVQNTGAAFGLFADSNGALIVLTLVILAVLGKMHRELASQGKWANVGILLVWGGALGNLTDRVRNTAVTDFLDIFWKGWHWPAFNVADSAITVGVTLLFVQNLINSFVREKS